MSTVIRVDDTDPGIAYTGQWFLGGQPPQEYNGYVNKSKSYKFSAYGLSWSQDHTRRDSERFYSFLFV